MILVIPAWFYLPTNEVINFRYVTTAALTFLAVLLAIEGASRMIAWRGKAGLPGKFGIPVTSLPAGLAFGVTTILAVVDLTIISIANPGPTSLSAGATLFAIGWFLRYPAVWDSRLHATAWWHRIQN